MKTRKPIEQLTAKDLIEVDESLFPMVVFSRWEKDFFSGSIRKATNSTYTHSMWFHRPGFFASQGWFFEEVAIGSYIGYQNSALEILYFPDWIESERERFLIEIQKLINNRGFYDILGIIGHIFGRPNTIESSRFNYCTESVWELFELINKEPEWHPTPKDLRFFLKKCYRAEVFGTYNGHYRTPYRSTA